MELTHRFSVPASLDQAWASFNDLESIAPCFPGATITGIDGDDFTGTVKIKLGPIAMLYNGTGTFATRDESAHRAVIEAKGKDKRGNGTASATVSATFSAEGDQTVVEVQTDLTVTGKPAQFGRGVISDISDKLLKQFVECISARFVADVGGGKDEEDAEDEATAISADPAAADPAVTGTTGLDANGHGGPEDSQPAGTGEGPAGGGAQSGGASGVGSASSGATDPPGHPASAWTPPQTEPAELNMLSTALPVLAKRYGPALVGALAVAALVIRLIRRRR